MRKKNRNRFKKKKISRYYQVELFPFFSVLKTYPIKAWIKIFFQNPILKKNKNHRKIYGGNNHILTIFYISLRGRQYLMVKSTWENIVLSVF